MAAPLHEPTFLVLAALAAEPLHGYGIIQAVSELSEGRVALRAGTLYPALDRLSADGLVELAREEVVDNRLRRYYRLTDSGVDRLRADLERQSRNVAAASARLASRAPAARPARGQRLALSFESLSLRPSGRPRVVGA